MCPEMIYGFLYNIPVIVKHFACSAKIMHRQNGRDGID